MIKNFFIALLLTLSVSPYAMSQTAVYIGFGSSDSSGVTAAAPPFDDSELDGRIGDLEGLFTEQSCSLDVIWNTQRAATIVARFSPPESGEYDLRLSGTVAVGTASLVISTDAFEEFAIDRGLNAAQVSAFRTSPGRVAEIPTNFRLTPVSPDRILTLTLDENEVYTALVFSGGNSSSPELCVDHPSILSDPALEERTAELESIPQPHSDLVVIPSAANNTGGFLGLSFIFTVPEATRYEIVATWGWDSDVDGDLMRGRFRINGLDSSHEVGTLSPSPPLPNGRPVETLRLVSQLPAGENTIELRYSGTEPGSTVSINNLVITARTM